MPWARSGLGPVFTSSFRTRRISDFAALSTRSQKQKGSDMTYKKMLALVLAGAMAHNTAHAEWIDRSGQLPGMAGGVGSKTLLLAGIGAAGLVAVLVVKHRHPK